MAEEKVSHEDLDASVAETDVPAEEKVEEAEEKIEEVAEQIAEEPDDNAERSMLGRKVKGLVDDIAEIKSLLSKNQAPVEPETDNEEIITTKEDVLKVLRSERQQETAQQQAYNKTVEAELIDLGLAENLDEKAHIAVFKDAQKNWKTKTGNAQVDAELNFKDALIRYTRAQVKQNKNPLEKNDGVDADGLGGAVETKVTQKTPAIPKLDPAAEDFVKRTGMKPESVVEALTGDMPTYLGGK